MSGAQLFDASEESVKRWRNVSKAQLFDKLLKYKYSKNSNFNFFHKQIFYNLFVKS